MTEFRSGFATLVGKPNTGKSTLLNTLVGHKISITSRKPQTTRHRILGVHTGEDHQLIFVDTPGLHKPSGKALNKIINRTARASLVDVDAIVVTITHRGWSTPDRYVLKALDGVSVPIVLVINKIDQVADKKQLLPLIQESSQLADFAEIIPLSAKTGLNTDALLSSLTHLVPVGPRCFPESQITDRDQRFMISELVREQLFRLLGEELPYATAVRVADWEDAQVPKIEAHIWVERDSQKGIVVGKDGQLIKQISTRARRSIEHFLGRKVYLHVLVKVRKGWADNQADLHSLGYSEGR